MENCCLSGGISGKQQNWEPHFLVTLDHRNGQCLNYHLGSFQVLKFMGKSQPAFTVMVNCRVIDGNLKTICQVEVWGGGKKGARDLKQFCWVLANHVDQELKVGGLGTEPVEIGPGDGVILDSNTFIFWLSSKGYFFSLFCSSTETSPLFSKIRGLMCSTCQVTRA